jgi:hypothetical protein
MWCCWIVPADNPPSTRRRSRRAPNLGQRAPDWRTLAFVSNLFENLFA